MQNDDKEQKTLFGFPVVEVDMPEMKDKIIILTDLSNWEACVNFTPPNERLRWTLRLFAWLKNLIGLGSRQ
jgi:hypothetical protein